MAALTSKSVAIISAAVLAATGGGAMLIALDGTKSDAEITRNDMSADSTASGEGNAFSEDNAVADETLSVEGDDAIQDYPSAANDVDENGVALEFTLGAFNDLKGAPLSDLVTKIERVPGLAEETKVWVATADIASAPGSETFYHVKGPLTCGSVGCELIVIGGARQRLLETIGERVDAPEIDTLIINQGTSSEVVWVFNGEIFVKK